jgi:transposase-like protein
MRSLTGTFGPTQIVVPRARIIGEDGKTAEWKYQRRTRQADALIAGAYLAGTNTRRVRRALAALFAGTVGKDVVSRVWRKVRTDWEAWNKRDLSNEPVVRLILDGTVVRVRLDKKATSISLLVVLGIREDGQKVLLAVKNMGGESDSAWRALLDDLTARGLRRPELVIVDGGSRPRRCCHRRRLQPCCFGLCWLPVRSRCAKSTAGRVSPRSLPTRSLTSPHDAVISSRWRLRQTQFQHKSRRHRN